MRDRRSTPTGWHHLVYDVCGVEARLFVVRRRNGRRQIEEVPLSVERSKACCGERWTGVAITADLARTRDDSVAWETTLESDRRIRHPGQVPPAGFGPSPKAPLWGGDLPWASYAKVLVRFSSARPSRPDAWKVARPGEMGALGAFNRRPWPWNVVWHGRKHGFAGSNPACPKSA